MVTQTLSRTKPVSGGQFYIVSLPERREWIFRSCAVFIFEVRGVCVILLAHIWVLYLRQMPSNALTGCSSKQRTILDGDAIHILVELVCRVHHVDEVVECRLRYYTLHNVRLVDLFLVCRYSAALSST